MCGELREDGEGRKQGKEMICPYCRRKAKIDEVVKLNLESYGRSVRARTRCCGALIRVRPVVSYRCEETDQKGKDDWGD